MPKLHARASIEIEVTEEELRDIYYRLGEKKPNYEPHDIDLNELEIDFEDRFTLCDWDEEGYIPGSWLEYDAVEAGIVPLEEVGVW